MLQIKKKDEMTAVYLEEDKIWEIMLTTTYSREDAEDGEKSHTYSVKTYDVNFERALITLYNSTIAYFEENMIKLFGKENIYQNVSNKGNEVSTT